MGSVQRFAFLGILRSGWTYAAPPMNLPPAPGVYVNSLGSPLLPLLNNAKKSVDIEIYTMGDTTVLGFIRAALSRRVKNAIPSMAQTIQKTYREFDQVGVASKFFDASDRIAGKPGYMHAKVIVADG
ncbi:hypothetical protein WDW37_20605 [Bdellovibrionota bacterium FG-1]